MKNREDNFSMEWVDTGVPVSGTVVTEGGMFFITWDALSEEDGGWDGLLEADIQAMIE